MKLAVITAISVSAGIASFDHLSAFLLALGTAVVAVSSCYFFAFRSTKFPELSLFLLICGMLSKLIVTITGVAYGIMSDLITSPIVFAMAYLFFAIAATYLFTSYRDNQHSANVAEVSAA